MLSNSALHRLNLTEYAFWEDGKFLFLLTRNNHHTSNDSWWIFLFFYTMWLAGSNGKERLQMSSPAWSLADHSWHVCLSAIQTLTTYPITTLCSAPTVYRMLIQKDLKRYWAELSFGSTSRNCHPALQNFLHHSGWPTSLHLTVLTSGPIKMVSWSCLCSVWCWAEASIIVAPFPTFMIIKMSQDVT